MSSELVKIRPVRPSDHAFIYATALRHLWYHPDNQTTFSKDAFMRLHHARLEKLLSTVPIEVAILPEEGKDKEVIVGYRIFDHTPFTYLRKSWRGVGIEKLFKELICQPTKP